MWVCNDTRIGVLKEPLLGFPSVIQSLSFTEFFLTFHQFRIQLSWKNITKFVFPRCTYMSIPSNSVCCSITPASLLTTEMWRTISGSRISFWSFRKGYRIFAGFSLSKRDSWSGIYSLELFLILFHFLFFFPPRGDRMWISVSPLLMSSKRKLNS